MLRVLIVDDNPGDVRLVRELLRDADEEATVRDAPTVTRALELLAGRDVDLVLLDLQLPDAVGLSGLERICAAYPSVSVVMLTGLNDKSMAVEALQAGAQDYLPKGRLDGDMMARAIRYAVERKKLEVAREQLVAELRRALAQVNTLSGLLPICAHCKKIRGDEGEWTSVDRYIAAHSGASFTHSICPACFNGIEQDIEEAGTRPPRR